MENRIDKNIERIINEVKVPETDERYFNSLLPRMKQRLEEKKRRRRKLIIVFAPALALLLILFNVVFITGTKENLSSGDNLIANDDFIYDFERINEDIIINSHNEFLLDSLYLVMLDPEEKNLAEYVLNDISDFSGISEEELESIYSEIINKKIL
jgi:hypothetical protein